MIEYSDEIKNKYPLASVFNIHPLPWSLSKWEGDVILDENGSLVIGYGDVGNEELFKAIVLAVNEYYQDD